MAYDVVSVFTIEDEASGVLQDMAAMAEKLASALDAVTAAFQRLEDKGITSVEALTRSVVDLGVASSDLSGDMTTNFASIASAMQATNDSAATLVSTVEAISAAAEKATASLAEMRVAGGSGGGGGGGGGGAGFLGLGALGKYIPPELAEAFAIYEGYRGAMDEDLSIRQTLIQESINPDSPQGQTFMAQLHQQIAEASRGTIFSARQTAEAYASSAGELGFSGPEGLAKAEQILPVATRMGEVAQMQMGANLDQSVVAGIQYAHMTGRYDPVELQKGLDYLLNLSEKTATSPLAEESILKYGVPQARQLGIDPDLAAEYIGFFQQQGLGGTTAGTTFGQILTGVLRTGGPISAQWSAQRDALEHDLSLQGVSSAKGVSESAHVAALKNLGILDKSGKLTTVDASGGLDITSIFHDIIAKAGTISPTDMGTLLYNAFGIRGQKGADILSDPGGLANLNRFVNTITTAAQQEGVIAQQQELANSPMQKFEQTISLTANILNDLARITLPAVNKGLDGLNWVLTQIDSGLSKFQWADVPHLFTPQVEPKNTPFWDKFGLGASGALNGLSPQFQNQAYTIGQGASSQIEVNINGLSIYGAGLSVNEYARLLADQLAKEISKAQSNNLGTGTGTYSSPMLSGGYTL